MTELWPEPRAVVFADFDDSLIEAYKGLEAAHDDGSRNEMQLEPTAVFHDNVRRLAGGKSREVFEGLFEKQLKRMSFEDREEKIRRLDEGFGERVKRYAHLINPIPNVPETVEALCANGIWQVIVTNRRRETLDDAMRRGNLKPAYFKGAYTREDLAEVGGKKGAIEHFRQEYGVQHLPACMVGDARGDIEAGVQANIPAYGVVPPGMRQQPEAERRLELHKAGARQIFDTYAQLGTFVLRSL